MTTAWDNLPKLLEINGGFTIMKVRTLRTFADASSAKVNVVARIERELAARKIGHLPSSAIPRDQNASVLLYNQDKPNIGAVLHLAQQLAEGKQEEGTSVTTQVRMLELALKMYGRTSEADGTAV